MLSKSLTSVALAAVLYISVAGVISLHAAQDATTPPTSLDNALPPNATGADIFRLACSTCHAIDGTGSPQSVVGFQLPLPDWQDALSDAQIERVVKHLWMLCTDPSWPRGDMNFPRAFFTEKAFPENE